MTTADQTAYLGRLGVEAEPPSADALIRLHRAQVERVPYETLWIHTGDLWGVDLEESVARIANVRRGGYCFHLNGAFSVLLESLGYEVTRHVGGVHGPVPVPELEMANHLVLTVGGLPTRRSTTSARSTRGSPPRRSRASSVCSPSSSATRRGSTSSGAAS